MPFGQRAADRLGERQIAGGGNGEDSLARLGEDVQLAEGRDVVEAGIGARIGDHHQGVTHQNSAAIGHGRCVLRGSVARLIASVRPAVQSRYWIDVWAGAAVPLLDRPGAV